MTSPPQMTDEDWTQCARINPVFLACAQEKQEAVIFSDGTYSFALGNVRTASLESLRQALNSRGHFGAIWNPGLIHLWAFFDCRSQEAQDCGLTFGMATWTWERPPVAMVACDRDADGQLVPLYHTEPLEGSGYVHETGHAVNAVYEPEFAGGEVYAENYSATMLQPAGKYPQGVLTPDALEQYLASGGAVPQCGQEAWEALYTQV